MSSPPESESGTGPGEGGWKSGSEGQTSGSVSRPEGSGVSSREGLRTRRKNRPSYFSCPEKPGVCDVHGGTCISHTLGVKTQENQKKSG